MPEIGEIRHDHEIGKSDHDAKYIWHGCIICGRQRWVKLNKGGPYSQKCHACAQHERKLPVLINTQLPKLGEIRKGRDIGLKSPGANYIWEACPKCKKERWVVTTKSGRLCYDCINETRVSPNKGKRGIDSYSWKGGKKLRSDGHVYVYVDINDFYHQMADINHYVAEHRLVMAKSLGRCLWGWEHIHHKNGIKHDNRLQNLEILTSSEHTHVHTKGYKDGYAKGLVDGRNRQIEELKQEIRLLQLQIQGELIK